VNFKEEHPMPHLCQERLDVARLVRRAAEDWRPRFEQAGLALAVETADTPVWVLGDPTWLAQAANRLLDHAGQLTDRGGHVTVRLVVDERANRARLTVQAAGSAAAQAAELSVSLPVEHEPPALSAPAEPLPRPERGSRILVVEDNRDAADSLKTLLRLMGHDTRVAYTGPEGLKAATEWVPDLVLCDIGLPGLDGYGVARALRLDPKTHQVRLLALTGYGSDEDRRLSREAGFDEHLTKPVAPQVLQEYLIQAKGRG
jgi:CheY-like chemotaxis protein